MSIEIESATAILVGLCTLGGVLFAAHRWVLAQDKLREDVKEQLAIQNVDRKSTRLNSSHLA